MKRPPSYSEGYIHELDRPLITDNYSINKYKPSEENQKIEIVVSTPVTYNYYELVINKLISMTIHLLLIAGFEIIFFNFYILSYENNYIIYIINQITYPITNVCSSMNNSTKIIVDNYINEIFNETFVNNNAIQGYSNRIYINNLIINKSYYFLVGIVIFLIGIFTSNFFYFKQRINYIIIFIDNIIMILILGIYEYIFFTNIVFKYQMISSSELIQKLMQNILLKC